MKVLRTLLLFILAVPAGAIAQDKIRSIAVTDTILYTAVDRPGEFYTVSKSGQIQRFNKDGKLSLLYKAETPPTVFDPRDGARLFAYYRHDQHYEYRTPSFDVMVAYQVDPSFAIEPWLICPSGDHKLWILDRADNSLKKINVRASEVELEVMVDSTLIWDVEGFTAMRDYQNFVFLLDRSRGILIFNSLGIHLRTIAAPGIHAFNFLGEDLYYLTGDSIVFFNLFTTETRRLKTMPGYQDVLLTDERMVLFTDQQMDIFPFSP